MLIVGFLITGDIGLLGAMRVEVEEFCCGTIYGICWFCNGEEDLRKERSVS